jgi:glutaminase
MYDYSGAWIYEVGMPAKSGVGGGVMAVLPGQLGIAVFSPPLDAYGNSVRGVAVCRRVSADFGLHMFHAGRTTATSVIRGTYNASQVPSKRTRHPAQTRLLKELGHTIVVIELQGDLLFASTEIVVTAATRAADTADHLILDFRRCASINEGAMSLLGYLIGALDRKGKTVLFTGIRDEYGLKAIIKRHVPQLRDLPLFKCDDVDHALEWCENRLLAAQSSCTTEEAPLAAQAFCAGFAPEELQALESLLEPKSYPQGACICRQGEPATGMFFILSGDVSVVIPVDHRRTGRISSWSAGSAFGEMAMFDHGVRSADVVADTDVSCLFLSYENLENDATEIGGRIRLKLVANIARLLSHKLRQATLEIKALKI